MEAATLAAAVLAAVAVVHGADKGSVTPLAAIVPVLPVLPAALPSLTLTLVLVLSVVLSVVAEAPFATPRLPVSRAVRLIRRFIHSSKPVSFWICPRPIRGNLS